jgi:hypothetical protein
MRGRPSSSSETIDNSAGGRTEPNLLRFRSPATPNPVQQIPNTCFTLRPYLIAYAEPQVSAQNLILFAIHPYDNPGE